MWNSRRSMLLAAGALGVFSVPVSAQTAAATAAAPVADDSETNAGLIVVTAQLRSQTLKDVPIAVSVVTARDIQNRNVSSLDDLQASVPSLRLVDIGPGSQRIQIRGVSQYLGLPTVGNYIDEFSINNFGASGVPEVELLDIARVEVLRGPQPALYGEGSMGGTIRYVTAKPDLSEIGGSAFGELSTVKSGEAGFRLEGILNVPIVKDQLGIRVAASRREVGGWIDGPLGDDVNDRQVTTVRGRLLYQPDDRLTISLLGLFTQSRQDSIGFSLDGRTTAQSLITPQEQEYKIGIAEISYDFGPVTLLSVTGKQWLTSDNLRDTAAFTNTLFAKFGIPVSFTRVANLSLGDVDRWSQELRLTSNGDGPLRYVLGASYAKGDSSGTTTIINSPAPFPVLSDDLRLEGSFKSEIFAAFGSVNYDVTDWLTIDAGGRYFSDKRQVFSVNTVLNGGTEVAGSPSGGEATFNTFNPRVGLTFKPSQDGIIYVSAARGFRSGGFNTAVGAVNPTFDPESLWTYEIGAKQSLFEGKLFAEIAFYFQDYKDIQSTNVTNTGSTEVFNAGKASGPGFDVILSAKPSRALSMALSLGYNHVRFDTNAVDKLKGDPLDLVPDFNVSASLDYTPALSDTLRLITHADLNYTSEAAIILRQIGALGFPTVTPNQSRTILNLRIGLATERLEGFVFASNVTNTLRQVNPAFGAFVEPIFTQPRTVGIGVRLKI